MYTILCTKPNTISTLSAFHSRIRPQQHRSHPKTPTPNTFDTQLADRLATESHTHTKHSSLTLSLALFRRTPMVTGTYCHTSMAAPRSECTEAATAHCDPPLCVPPAAQRSVKECDWLAKVPPLGSCCEISVKYAGVHAFVGVGSVPVCPLRVCVFLALANCGWSVGGCIGVVIGWNIFPMVLCMIPIREGNGNGWKHELFSRGITFMPYIRTIFSAIYIYLSLIYKLVCYVRMLTLCYCGSMLSPTPSNVWCSTQLTQSNTVSDCC